MFRLYTKRNFYVVLIVNLLAWNIVAILALVVAVISLAVLGFFDNGEEVPLDSSENYSKQNYSSAESTNSTAFSESPENETKLAESNISSGVYTHTLDNSDILNYSNNIQSDVDSSSSSSLSGSVSNVVQSDSISFVPFTLPELFDAEKVVTVSDVVDYIKENVKFSKKYFS